jgi:hypothetical protein
VEHSTSADGIRIIRTNPTLLASEISPGERRRLFGQLDSESSGYSCLHNSSTAGVSGSLSVDISNLGSLDGRNAIYILGFAIQLLLSLHFALSVSN